ncbi:hypothetical protein POSPLADRAFT_1037627 [Postia placenta MAD-698-R-SB12]|uniref:Uncharacterized protein n=1 Tax=Postia placenta MAD-698-R-SB12 TaxID=670580 RepID=A0A1X6MK08_9APHY|nr:hypothetical protein POSPLADRAFT_1037627 [Postia placenta MAD-698-R-SB12]OSX56373.1 hypothetical protein POSPLADRAFT_1037627 [Postia placenta MAD-698-R-SB12]
MYVDRARRWRAREDPDKLPRTRLGQIDAQIDHEHATTCLGPGQISSGEQLASSATRRRHPADSFRLLAAGAGPRRGPDRWWLSGAARQPGVGPKYDAANGIARYATASRPAQPVHGKVWTPLDESCCCTVAVCEAFPAIPGRRKCGNEKNHTQVASSNQPPFRVGQCSGAN